MKGERDGKCEGKNEKCEFLARESVSSSPIVRFFGKGKCKFIANFSATQVTSLPSFSVSLSLSPNVPHAQYRKRFRASYNKGDINKVILLSHYCLQRSNELNLWCVRCISHAFSCDFNKFFLPPFPCPFRATFSNPSSQGHTCRFCSPLFFIFSTHYKENAFPVPSPLFILFHEF